MSEPENKDKIKEILEGHNKKFTSLELIVGIIVILIIGSGIGYAIFKLLTPSPTTPPKVITEIQQPQVPPMNEEENSSVEQPTIKTSSEKQLESVESKSSEMNGAAIKSPAPQPTMESKKEGQEGKTQNGVASEETASNETEANTNTVSEQAGPTIIPPKSETKQNEKVEKKAESVIKKGAAKIKKSAKNTLKKRINGKNSAIALAKSKRVSHKSNLKRKSRSGVYILQVSSNKNRKLAILTVIKLRKCGHKAYTKEVEVKGEKYTRVYVGPIRGYSAARLEAKEIKRQLHLGYLPIIKRDD